MRHVVHGEVFRVAVDAHIAPAALEARHGDALGHVLGVVPGVELVLEGRRRLHQDEEEAFLAHACRSGAGEFAADWRMTPWRPRKSSTSAANSAGCWYGMKCAASSRTTISACGTRAGNRLGALHRQQHIVPAGDQQGRATHRAQGVGRIRLGGGDQRLGIGIRILFGETFHVAVVARIPGHLKEGALHRARQQRGDALAADLCRALGEHRLGLRRAARRRIGEDQRLRVRRILRGIGGGAHGADGAADDGDVADAQSGAQRFQIRRMLGKADRPSGKGERPAPRWS